MGKWTDISRTFDYNPRRIKEDLMSFEDALGELAYDDVVEIAKLGETIIQGGYLKTDLIYVAMLSAISSILGTVDVGGSGNGNGQLRVRDENNDIKVLLNQKGITLADDTEIVGGNGVLSVLQVVTDWQWVGMSYQYQMGGRPNITIDIPSNFVITSANLETIVKYKYMHGFSGQTTGYYAPTSMTLYTTSNPYDVFIDWGWASEFYDVPGDGGRTNRTSALWGVSSWSPAFSSGRVNAANRNANIASLLSAGSKTTFYVQSGETFPTNEFFRGSELKFIATIKGYQK